MDYFKIRKQDAANGICYSILKKLCLGNLILRNIFYWYINKYEGGQYYSKTIRKIYKEVYDIDVGIGTYGCFNGNFRPHCTIGNYCSIAPGVHRLVGNHPLNMISTHPLFHLKDFGACTETKYEYHHINIGNDVWIGTNAVILSGCESIGNGAVIGAGAVVLKDIPPYAVVGGVPAKLIKYRFDEKTIKKIEDSKWWSLSPDELLPYIKYADNINVFLDCINDRFNN